MAEERLKLAGNPGIEVRLRRSERARRLSLRVSRLDGRVTLTLPVGVPRREALAFLNERGDWLRGHLDRRPAEVAVAPGIRLPVLGEGLTLTEARVRGPEREGDRLLVAPGRAAPQALAYVRETARARLGARCDGFAGRLGCSYVELALRDTRSRWGSCSSEGRLMFSWRLAMAPARILDYVAAHEVAHLVEMNHSPAFWAVVARLHPDWAADRGWLQAHGAWLHRYRFDAAPAERAA